MRSVEQYFRKLNRFSIFERGLRNPALYTRRAARRTIWANLPEVW